MTPLTEPLTEITKERRDQTAYRVAARIFDVHIGMWVLLLAVWMWKVEEWTLWLWLIAAGAFAVDVLIYAMLGTTLGRWWLGLRVVDREGVPLSRWQYLARNGAVWVKGTACCLVPFAALPFLAVYRQLLRGEAAFYDRRTGHRVVEERPVSEGRKTAFSLVMIVFSLITAVVMVKGFFDLWQASIG